MGGLLSETKDFKPEVDSLFSTLIKDLFESYRPSGTKTRFFGGKVALESLREGSWNSYSNQTFFSVMF